MRTVLAALMVMVLVIPAHARGKQRPGAEPQQAADRQKSSREEEKVSRTRSVESPIRSRWIPGAGCDSGLQAIRPCPD